MHEDDGGADPEFHRPLIFRTVPAGRTPSTTSRRPKATAGAHDAPSNMSTIDSAMPRIRPGDQRAGHAAQAREHHHAERAADVEAVHGRARPGRR